MKVLLVLKLTLALLFNSLAAMAQKSDTIQITSEHVNAKELREGTHRYLVYAKMKKDGNRILTQFWTRTISRTSYNGVSAIEINQEWEDKDSVIHTVKSICSAKTLQPFYHKSWWKVQAKNNSPLKTVTETSVDFLNRTIVYNGEELSDSDTVKRLKMIWNSYKSSQDKFFLNWHLDLETFPLLPYKDGAVFSIPFYDPGTPSGLQNVIYTVKGSDKLIGYDDQKIDCWLLVHKKSGNKEVFWISKKTREVLKLEQEINGRFYRYKIKMGFSI